MVRAEMVRRSLVVALVVAVAVAVTIAPRPTAAANSCPQPVGGADPIDRVAGADRYATAACVAEAAYPTVVGTVLLARGDDAGAFADALAGTVLAHAVDGPTLLTAPRSLPAPTRAALARLRPSMVLVLGGSAAVGDPVLASVRAVLPTARVERIAGGDRAATAAAVSAEAGATRTAFVVNGRAPADALVAGAPAARRGAKLLLSTATSVPDATAGALEDVTEVVIVGGHDVVTAKVEDELAAAVGAGHVTRVGGGNRYETAASVARRFPAEGRIHLTGGANRNLADAIAAGWSAARAGGGVVLYAERDRPGPATDRYLRLGGLGAVEPVRLVGGTAALSSHLVATLGDRYDEAASGGPAPQLRAVWVHLFDDTLKTPEGIDRMLDAVAAENFNTVVVEVVRRQDAYYTSAVLPATPDPALAGDLDVLARVLSAARDRGLQVHAWFPALPAWHSEYRGLRLPLWEAHGIGSSDPWVSVTHGGAQGQFFDPGVPEVADLVVSVARELATRYAVDAVHVDYLRYESQEWGYHPESLARFRAAYGLASSFVPAPDDWRWDAWRREQTRAIAERVRDAVHQARPTTAVTLAGSTIGEPPRTITDYTNTRTWGDVFQAWPQWLATGLVDAVFAMNYFRESSHPGWYDGWAAFERRLDDDCDVVRPPCVVAVGQAAYLNRPQESVSQLTQALADTDGAAVFSYQQSALEGSSPVLPTLSETVFRAPAPAPALRLP